MCASPGSKTAQILEALHTPELSPALLMRLADVASGAAAPHTLGVDCGTDGGAPPATGYVLANDIEPKRGYMLAHQVSGQSAAVRRC